MGIFSGAWDFTDIWNSAGSESFRELDELERRILPDEPINIQYTSVGRLYLKEERRDDTGDDGIPEGGHANSSQRGQQRLFHWPEEWLGQGGGSILTRVYGQRTAIMGWGPCSLILSAFRTKSSASPTRCRCLPGQTDPSHFSYHAFGCMMGSLNAAVHQQTCVFPAINFQIGKVIRAIEEERRVSSTSAGHVLLPSGVTSSSALLQCSSTCWPRPPSSNTTCPPSAGDTSPVPPVPGHCVSICSGI